jgi:hypothetical protein
MHALTASDNPFEIDHFTANPTRIRSGVAGRMSWEDLLMNAQTVDSTALDEPTRIRSLPERGTNGNSHDGGIDEAEREELLNYRPVPPRRVVTMPVQYRQLGRGRPLPYHLEEDPEE